jgi:hypothetical protein
MVIRTSCVTVEFILVQQWVSYVRFQVLTAASMKIRSSGMYCRVRNWMSTDVSEVRAASIIREHAPLKRQSISN